MDIQSALKRVVEGRSLSREEMTAVMRMIMTGQCTPAQIGGLLVALRMKGETVDELVGAASVMRELATPVEVQASPLVDTCGTGGDGSGTFNISTAAAFVVAAAGGHVAKHGNRSVSSRCGSADVLEAAGVDLALTPEQVARCIDTIGVGFMFAPAHHGAMKHAIGPRREMAIRTLFNLLGPLTNPAGARRQVMGVFAPNWVRPIAEVLRELGAERVLVVHAEDGLDEISIAAPTLVAELRDGEIHEYTVTPEQFGMERSSLQAIGVTDAKESLALIRRVFDGEPGPAADIVALNAGAAIYVSGLATSLAQGVVMAQDAIASELPRAKLQELAQFTAVFSGEQSSPV